LQRLPAARHGATEIRAVPTEFRDDCAVIDVCRALAVDRLDPSRNTRSPFSLPENNMIQKCVSAAAIAALAVPSFSAQALPDVAVGVTAGTAGIGGQVTAGVLPFLNVRGSIQGFGINRSINEDGIDYDGKLQLLTYGAYVDVYPFIKGPRLSAGLVGNANKVRLRATCEDSCEVGDLTVSGRDAQVNGRLGFNGVSPYLGLGFTNPIQGLPFYVGFDAGVLFHGKPKPQLSAAGTGTISDGNGTRANVDLANDPAVQDAIAREESNLAADIDQYKFYPVVQVSIGWRF